MAEEAKSIDEIIRADPHIVRIIEPEQWDLPPISYESLAKGMQRSLKTFEEIAKKYLSMKYIIDDFETDHDARDDWRQQYYAMPWGHKYLTEDALKVSVVGGALIPCIQFVQINYEGPNKDAVDRKWEEMRTHINFHEYPFLATEQKVKKIQTLKQKVYEFYCLIVQA